MPTTKVKKSSEGSETYIEALGRRKTAVARVRIVPSTKTSFEINEKTLEVYFPTLEMQKIIREAVERSGGHYKITARIHGGGIHGHAEAMRLGIARAIVKSNEEMRKPLKAEGLLKRDPRAKERRKFGLKKARKAPQWSKR